MKERADVPSTGLKALDDVIEKVIPGDNIVWRVDAIEDYAAFVTPFVEAAHANQRKLIYFRFARHRQLVTEQQGAEIHRLSPDIGFENFTAQIHDVIERAGYGAHYVFDCLSDLAADWYSDLMLGNFFMVTCPYLYELETIAYFGILRDLHSLEAISAIRETTQLLLDIFRRDGELYVHPLKVDQRHSPTMYLPHHFVEGTLRPLTESSVLSEVLVELLERRANLVARTFDIWDRKFVQAQELLDAAKSDGARGFEADELFQRLIRMIFTRDRLLVELASKVLDLSDILATHKRMIGTGLIGGKAVGMLLARAILCKSGEHWRDKLEKHDSFFIGTDVFYTYLVRNDCWKVRRNQRSQATLLDGAKEAQQKILEGTFSTSLRERCVQMLEYFGQAPIIVRSSSLLEDGFGNAFTGKYESIFCPNQGSPEERLAAFLSAVRTVYASTMSEEALLYRAHRGLLEKNEQMAILVQRVSGAVYGDLFYPQIAGVGLSYNPYAWSEYVEPEAGVLRLVLGLGTRAVDRADDDYTRIVALNAPLRRPEANFDEITEYAQHRVDVLDLRENCFKSLDCAQVIESSENLAVEMFASRRAVSNEASRYSRAPTLAPWVLTFENLLSTQTFVQDMREILQTLRDAYAYPVDVEFTANFLSDGRFRINIVQCRPLQVKEGGNILPPPDDLAPPDILVEASGTLVGQSSFTAIDRLIYIDPSQYGELALRDRYAIARLIGRLTHLGEGKGAQTVMLLGPGRWGTSTPSLGVPVSFAEINTVSVLCEIVPNWKHAVPDVSLGTHFFNDLVEANILYLAIYPGKSKNGLNEAFFAQQHNRLPELLPGDAAFASVVHVIDSPVAPDGRALYLNANCLKQSAICYLASPD